MFATMRRLSRSIAPEGPQKGAPALAEARADPRHETAITARLGVLGVEHDCVIANISAGGATIVAPGVAICVAQQVIVSSKSTGTLFGSIRWFRGDTFGVQFANRIAPSTLDQARLCVPSGMQPRASRARVAIPAMAHFGALHRKVVVANISVGGLKMTMRMPLRPMQLVSVELPDLLPLGGHVRWADDGGCGVMFTKLLPVPVASTIAARYRLSKSWLDDVRAAHEGG